jgi:hypothetical protein
VNRSPPLQRPCIALAALLLVCAAAATPATGQTDGPCVRDDPGPDLTDRGNIDPAFVDALENGSLADWDGGRLAPVGAAGDCSLVVTDGRTATLTAATVNGTSGIATGTLDLGANGSLAFVPENGTALALTNEGPDFAATVTVAAGNRTADVDVATGRFLDFLVRWDDGTARVAVWDADDRWDGDWDGAFETGDGNHTVELAGTAFLDEIALGVPAEPTPTPSPGGDSSTDPDGDEFPGSETPDGPVVVDDPDDPADDGPNPVADGFLALLVTVGGAFIAVYARAFTRFGEQLDAIGSTTRWEDVEPAEWNVLLTRLIAGAFAAGGFVWLLTIVF